MKKYSVTLLEHVRKTYEVKANNEQEAVDIASNVAEPGEAVLLSPACASWGMFDNYEQRGDMFKEFVNQLGA